MRVVHQVDSILDGMDSWNKGRSWLAPGSAIGHSSQALCLDGGRGGGRARPRFWANTLPSGVSYLMCGNSVCQDRRFSRPLTCRQAPEAHHFLPSRPPMSAPSRNWRPRPEAEEEGGWQCSAKQAFIEHRGAGRPSEVDREKLGALPRASAQDLARAPAQASTTARAKKTKAPVLAGG